MKLLLSHLLQRDPAEEALKCNNMNLDQAMSELQSILFNMSSVVMLLCY